MKRLTWRRSLLSVLLALGCAGASAQQPLGPEDAPKLARELARRLPTSRQVAADGSWKLPWEISENLPRQLGNQVVRRMTQDDYWRELPRRVPFGVNERSARDWLKQVFASLGKREIAEAGGQQQARLMALRGIWAILQPPALAAATAKQTSATARSARAILPHLPAPGAPRPSRAEGERIQKLMMARMFAPVARLSFEALTDLLVEQLTLPHRATELSYAYCNNWKELLTRQDDLKGVEFGTVVVRLVLVPGKRVGEIVDLTEAGAAALNKQLNDDLAAQLAMTRRSLQIQLARIDERLRGARPGSRREKSLRKDRDQIRRGLAGWEKAAYRVALKDRGDNSYTIDFDLPLQNPGSNIKRHQAFLRNGVALVTITVGGNLPRKRIDALRDRFLKLMDHNTAGYAD